MAEQEYIQVDTSLFGRLKRLFSNDVVIRNIGGNELKVMDINNIQKSGKYQTNALVDRFTRLYTYGNNRNVFNPNLNYQTLRIQLYSDYEAMDTDPIIASALDVVADECLLKSDRGEILTITSSDDNIKRVLENLFYDVLNVEFNLWSWVRGMLKYGDFFLKLEISEDFGIYNVLPYSVYHIARLEGVDPKNPQKVTFTLNPEGIAASADPNYVPKDGAGGITLENYEVAHFRLNSDTNYLPYGRSYIEPARKIFKQLTLCLPGSAKLWVPEKGYVTMEDIQVGDSIYSFDYKSNRFVKSKVTYKIDTGEKATYKIWTKHRCVEVSGDHPVMVEGGIFKKAVELTLDDYIIPAGNLPEENRIPSFTLPDSQLKARLTKDGAKKFKALRDRCLVCGKEIKNNNHVHIESHGISTEEYFKQFGIDRVELGNFGRLRWISYEKAKHYCKLYGLDEKYLQVSLGGNSKVYVNPEKIESTSKEFIRFFGFMLGDGWSEKYHVSFSLGNRLDKSMQYVDYLRRLGYTVSIGYEGTTKAYAYIQSKQLVQIMSNLGWKTGCKNKELPEWVWNLPSDYQKEFLYGFSDADGTFDPSTGKRSICGINKNLIEGCYVLAQQVGFNTTNLSCHEGGYKGYWNNTVNDLYGFGYSNSTYHVRKSETGVYLDKIVKIEKVSDGKQVYDITVESELHNFVADGVVVSNCEDAALIHRIMRAPEKRVFYINVGQIPPNEVEQFMQKTINTMKKTPYVGQDGQYNLRFNMQNMMEDFYIPVRGGDTSTRIDTTPGLNYDGVQDIRYYQEKLFSALKIPKAYLGYEAELSGKATLSAEDIRFARTVERVQRIVESELVKIAMVHLYAQGFTGESLVNFDIKLTTPSVIFEQEKIALLKEKVDLATQMIDSQLFSSDFIYESIFGVSEEDYLTERNLVREDAKRKFRLSQIETEGNDPALSGKSYGTPHDLASMYGRRGSPVPKGAELGSVPAGYEERPRWGEPGPEGGRPRIRASVYGTQNNPAGGADPVGKYAMHGGYPSDREYVMEGIGREVNVFPPKEKEKEVEMLQESHLEDVKEVLGGVVGPTVVKNESRVGPNMLDALNIRKVDQLLKRLNMEKWTSGK